MSETMKQFSAARRASVPIIIWKTPDAAATISTVRDGAKGPIFSWDIVRGIVPVNEAAVAKIPKTPGPADEGGGRPMTGIGNPLEMLAAMQQVPADSIMFMHNAHLFTGDQQGSNAGVVQAIWNLRDSNKSEHRALVMLAPQMRTPLELSNDVLVIDESLPDETALSEIVETQCQHARTGAIESGAKFKEVTGKDVEKAVDALAGLSAFAAEQTVAVSFEKNGDGVTLNQRTLWDRKRQAIEETRGLKVWRDGETLNDVQGCANIKKFAGQIIGGRLPPRVVVFIDEIEKSGLGNTGDLSGTNMDQLGVVLVKMQDTKAQGMLLVGPPGSAKSMFAKAFGNSAGIVTIQMDLGAMKGSLVGESERYIRAAMKVIDAVSRGRALYIATCNQIDSLPAALKRRFTLGTFYFDLPTAVEGEAIWKFYLQKFDLDGDPKKLAKGYLGWTGADIFNCCNRAWMFNCPVVEAARYATPVCKTDPAGIEKLRKLADGAFISANYEGIYQMGKDTVALNGARKREMRFDE